MPPIIVIRPEPGTSATVAAAGKLGLHAQGFPLFAVSPLAWDPVAREDVDALLLGSANALRHGGSGIAGYRGLPAYVVGARTAEAAREAGLEVVQVARGGLQSVMADLAPGHHRLLRLAGRERVELVLPAGHTMITREVYASRPRPFPPELAALLERQAIVLLHSGEAAAHFAAECERLTIDRSRIALACIGPRVAHRAGGRTGKGWAKSLNANAPEDAALLALAAEMCKDFPSGS
ncbi:MAG: uroporphyrinogen III synthase [Novosphingobium pentaromativorans]|uniref:Uroporphyrinogen III synthase n=1 Tax=Novosphingobium pentaromativorans TaxID=205844 RepID=A0A2W5NQ98_9SPHN|nr:MAG: uroporphyrinogen III synthase [Novosphingobium pentaromativorans]